MHVDAADVYTVLESQASGLDNAEATARLAAHGPSVLRETPRRSSARRLAATTHLMAIMLWVGSVIALVAGLPQLSVAIVLVNVINTGVFAGTTVATGRGKAVVVATGMDSEFGRIAGLTQDIPGNTSPLQQELARLSKVVSLIAVGVGVLLAGLSRRRSLRCSGPRRSSRTRRQPGTSTRGLSAVSAPMATPSIQAGRAGSVPSANI